MITKNFEMDLVDALQPIRSYVLATAIYHLFETGIYDLINQKSHSINALISTLQLERERTIGFLNYCSNENIVLLDDTELSLTEYGKSLLKFRGWYEMMIGGYGNTFLQMGTCLRAGTNGATRDAKHVGIGSCAISQYDALPLTKKLLSLSSKNYQLALDIGCGNAQYLVEFCHYFPQIKAVGVEPDKEGFFAAQKLVEAHDLSDRVYLANKTALEFFSGNDKEPDIVIISFVLHEILGQSGEKIVKEFLRSIVERYPEIDIVVIEVDNQITNPTIMQHGLSGAYYNPYYLLHYFTDQKLETDAYWTDLFADCNLDIIGKDYPDYKVDSTKLEIGYLLRAKKCQK
ncbi:MAG: 2-ketoarginine methyltransferase [Gammaproteobacteria bacterium]|nr:2-ketoarginine methyltransferase [Gammaproteobacteria bacterium]